ncbi:MAG: TolC family protein [Candidatus Aminicenantes bacterium]|nr:TolC family protein [Candidatus Aminicenantes bacterium]
MMTFLLTFFLLLQPMPSQTASTPLQEYIDRGLKSNLALKQQEFSLENSLENLREAKGLFSPTISVQARYSRAGGGRIIDFPVGDLTNPIYRSLNELYRFHGISASFPTDIPNERIPFLRPEEQETKLRLIQPLFQPVILYNVKIKSSISKAQEAQVAAFKRQLTADIKSAYYTYLKTVRIVELLEKTRLLLEENLRVSRKLYENGKATEDVVFRAEAELAGLDQKRTEAEKNRTQAASYFNFLLNRELDAHIKAAKVRHPTTTNHMDLETAFERALQNREEFLQMKHAVRAAAGQVSLAQSRFLPSVSAVFDYGIQGEKYSFKKDDDYWMASLIFEWTLFNGNRNKAQKAQAILAQKKMEAQRTELQKQIKLQVQEGYFALKAAVKALSAAAEREKSAKRSFDIVAKKYEYGTVPQIAYLDARTTLTDASINHIIILYDYCIQEAAFERVTAAVELQDEKTRR